MSRDASRIGPFLAQLELFWEENPDWRFGQVIMNLSRNPEGFADIWEWDVETFYARINTLRNNE